MRSVAENIKHYEGLFLIALDQLEQLYRSPDPDPSMRSFWQTKAASLGGILAGLAVVEAREKSDAA